LTLAISGGSWILSMRARLLLLLAVLLGIAIAPVKPVLAACAPAAPVVCASCCADSAQACCSASAAPTPVQPLAPVNPGDDTRQISAPTMIFLCLSPIPVAESSVVHHSSTVRLPAPALFRRHCMLLI